LAIRADTLLNLGRVPKRERPSAMPLSHELPLLSRQSAQGDQVRSLDLTQFDLRWERYRLVQPKAEQLMLRSLSKYGQIAPVVCCQLEGSLVLVDGFKRLRAARSLKGVSRGSSTPWSTKMGFPKSRWPRC
jgi:hypothetical protein